MAPPGLFKKRTELEKPAKEENNEVEKDTQYPGPKKHLLFARFPAEVQQQVWAEAVEKPACHSFKVVKSDYSSSTGKWEIHLQALWPRNDPSAYRWWKSLLRCKRKTDDDEKLKNISFQAGFRHAMVEFQPICLKTKRNGYQLAAAINVATDLVIIDFDRGATAQSFTWFEHSTTGMDLNTIRHRMRHFKRVAVHYKGRKAGKPGPFQCHCTSQQQVGCHNYKACCSELACFLDCFPELEEFYFVVEEPKGEGKARKWLDEYKSRLLLDGLLR